MKLTFINIDFDETIAYYWCYNVTNKETGEQFQTESQEEYDAIKDMINMSLIFNHLIKLMTQQNQILPLL